MERLLAGHPIHVHSLADFPDAPDVEETEDTLEGNAMLKATAIFEHTGLPSLADDTGLEVDVLDGRPGVFSARFAGEQASDADNRALLLNLLAGEENRTARFKTVVAIHDTDGITYFEGVCEGHITRQERGMGGFGYDPIFVPEDSDCTFAELDAKEKNRISHRGRAMAAYVSSLDGALTHVRGEAARNPERVTDQVDDP